MALSGVLFNPSIEKISLLFQFKILPGIPGHNIVSLSSHIKKPHFVRNNLSTTVSKITHVECVPSGTRGEEHGSHNRREGFWVEMLSPRYYI